MPLDTAIVKIEEAIAANEEKEEKRYTKENSSGEDIERIRNTIMEIEPGILFWYETTYQTKYSLGIQQSKVEELIAEMDHFVFVIDLTRAKKPGADTRADLKSMFTNMKLVHASIYTGNNVFLNIAAKFILSSVFGKVGFNIVKERATAVEEGREALQDYRKSAGRRMELSREKDSELS